MRLNDRIKAIEQRSAKDTHGVVIVGRYERVEDAIKRTGFSEDRLRKGVIIVPEKAPRDVWDQH